MYCVRNHLAKFKLPEMDYKMIRYLHIKEKDALVLKSTDGFVLIKKHYFFIY